MTRSGGGTVTFSPVVGRFSLALVPVLRRVRRLAEEHPAVAHPGQVGELVDRGDDEGREPPVDLLVGEAQREEPGSELPGAALFRDGHGPSPVAIALDARTCTLEPRVRRVPAPVPTEKGSRRSRVEGPDTRGSARRAPGARLPSFAVIHCRTRSRWRSRAPGSWGHRCGWASRPAHPEADLEGPLPQRGPPRRSSSIAQMSVVARSSWSRVRSRSV
jgi:hypothetical protein